jgi:hypothetical protein
MMILLTLLVGLAPIAAVVGLFWIVSERQRRFAERVMLQVRVTDAIHAELGAVAAPEVRRRLDGGWRVQMRVPAGRPGLVGPLVDLAELAMRSATSRPFEIVLLPPRTATSATRPRRLATPLAAPAR